ncbi:MAG TPA: glycosyltransferase family 2 protein [Candidatus Saccharimonadales bacterium]|nr:glycosyltransferase family 2 protein [Candidatus Saccharimonadales bacterium]
MTYVLGLLCLSAALELAIHLLPPTQKAPRRILAVCAAGLIGFSSIVWLDQAVVIFSVLMVVVSAYRIFNIARTLRARMHAEYLWRVTRRTSYWLITAQGTLALLWAAWEQVAVNTLLVWEVIIAGQFLTALIMAISTWRHARRMRTALTSEPVLSKELPSLTVAIPARNETSDLEQCLESVLASDYPKLEVLVLDDCSQSTRTPEVIRSFAHRGVRFIQGREPAQNWLSKNQAYDDLVEASSSELLVFIGVDIRLQPQTLRRLAGYSLHKDKDMVCVMPLNVSTGSQHALIQPLRYLSELALPRRFFRRPPVLSSCWLIRKAALKRAGGFAAAARMIIPEAYFARQSVRHDGYSFLASGSELGVASHKQGLAQRDTAIRVAYPQLHRRPEIVALLTSAVCIWSLTLLLVVVEAAVWRQFPAAALLLAVLTWGLYVFMYRTVLLLAYGRAGLMQLCSLPVAALGYIWLVNYSMYKYEFSEVLWKGRNICLPVMHVFPRLPKL